jgi:hypothetical protein
MILNFIRKFLYHSYPVAVFSLAIGSWAFSNNGELVNSKINSFLLREAKSQFIQVEKINDINSEELVDPSFKLN